jgi:hypothetical protein
VPATSELTIRWAPIPGTAQEPFFDDDTPDADIGFFGGYASGKTMTLMGKALKLSAINAPLLGIWVVPDYAHIFDTILPTLESTDPDTGDPWFLSPGQFHFHQGRHVLTWEGGGPILFLTAENPDSIAGPNAAFALADEPGRMVQKAWRNASARVRHPGAVLRQRCLAGTPEGFNWLADLFGPEAPANRHAYYMNTGQNCELLRHHPEYLEQVRANATDAEIASYLGGQFVNLLGAQAYPAFNRNDHWDVGVPDASPDDPLRLAFDFNVDPMTLIVGQERVGPHGPEIHVTDSFALYASTVMQVCAAFVERYPSWRAGLVIYGDATGSRRSHQSLRSNYEVIQDLLKEVGPIDLRVPRENPPVARRLNSVNRFLKDARGVVRLRIRKTEPGAQCRTLSLVRSLEQTVKKPGTDDVWKKPGETVTHSGEALGYWVTKEYPAEKPGVFAGAMQVDWI